MAATYHNSLFGAMESSRSLREVILWLSSFKKALLSMFSLGRL